MTSNADRGQAQQAFTSVQAFGDSYVDTGNLFRITGTPGAPFYPTGRFSGGTNYVDTISSLLGIPQRNFAIGGATSGTTNVVGPGIPGFTQEWQGFLGSGMRIAPSDLVVVNIGGNDARAYYQPGGTLAGVPVAAATTTNQTLAGINALVAAGARTLLYTVGDVSTLPEAVRFPNAAVGSAYSQTFNQQAQAGLATIAAGGVRVEYVDIGLIGRQITANPALYGFQNAGACPMTSCIGNPAVQNQYLFYFDGVHLTSHGFAVLGQYVVNRLEAPAAIAPQADGAAITEMAFAQNLFGRMDMFRGTVADGGYRAQVETPPRYRKGPPDAIPVFANPFSAYILVDGATGDGARTTTGAGYSFSTIGGIVGAEYQLGPHALIGAAFNYDNPQLKLRSLNATTDFDSYQFGVYGTWTSADFFAQGLGIVGFQNYRNARPGVVDTITSAPDGNTFAVGGKVGKLFDVGIARIGPIAGLTYGRSQIDGFTETGDPALTLAVRKQTEEALVASGGAQIRYPLTLASTTLEPYLNLTVESDLIGNGRLIQYGATSAPLIVNTLNVPDNTSGRVYGRVAGGVAAAITSRISLSLFATTTVGRRGGDDFSGSGGLKIAF